MSAELQQQLIQVITDSYDLNNLQYTGLRCKAEPLLLSANMFIPDFGNSVDITRIGPDLTWEFTIPEEIEDSVSLCSSKRTIPCAENVKLRHEFVSETLISGTTDIKLRDVFEVQNDDDDILTPDIIIKEGPDIIHVIEVATSRSPRSESLKYDFDIKKFKYEGPLQNRSYNKIITYTPIIVGTRQVVCNIPLPQAIIYELLVRMSISIAVENCALGKGISISLDEESKRSTRIGDSILDTLKTIEFKEPIKGKFISINEDYIKEVLGDVDEEFCRKSFMHSKRLAYDNCNADPNSQFKIDNYIQKLKSDSNKRYDCKPVCSVPLINVAPTLPSTRPIISNFPAHSNKCPISSLWGHAISQVSNKGGWENENHDGLLKEAYSTDKSKVKNFEETRHKYYKQAFRVDMKEVLSTKMKSYLSKDGLFGKQFKNDPYHKTRVKYQKESFNYSTDVEDITNFINDKELLERSDYNLPESTESILDLVNHAENLAGNTKFNIKVLEEWCKTKWFSSIDFLSDVGMELAISIKQNTKQSEMILKKIRQWNANILIKTTNSDSHIFFSIMLPQDYKTQSYHPSVFKSFIQAGRNRVTEFSSCNKDKLTNLINAPSRFLSLIAFWSDFYNLPDYSVSSFKKCPSATKMLQLSMLTSLENKAETEESMTLIRYMYMELFKMNVTTMKPDPFKILRKFTNKPRSRLNLWVIKNVITRFKTMTLNTPYRVNNDKGLGLEDGEDSLPGDEWNNLLNVYIGDNIKTATAAVNLMYLGYLKDKNETGQKNSEWGLVEKIIEEETQITNHTKPEYYGKVKFDELPLKKEFSIECIKFGSSLMERKLKNVLGPDWKKIISLEIRDSLARCLTHEIATLKASAHLKDDATHTKMKKSDMEKTKRVKVIEAIASKLGLFGLNPMLNFKTFLENVETKSCGVICDLFKKQQHGGLREIYVLTIESRILQLYIETISRILCSYFEEETLTHPQNKLKILDQHKMRSARIGKSRNSIFADFCSSSDKTRWNQNFLMTAMCIPLFRLTEEFLHPSIQRCLNLWSTKFIKLPPAVCNLLHSGTLLNSEVYKELLKKYENRSTSWCSQNLINQPGGSFLRTTSGMMQGILHYLSSLVHMTFLYSSKALTINYLRSRYSNKGYRFSMSSVCSSDDSATILTVFTDKDPLSLTIEDISVFMDSESTLQSLAYFCRYFCMIESEKSTLGLYDYVEFNSEFLFKNTLAMPIIKFVAACTTLTESESFSLRFHEFYNLISNLYSSGFPSYNTHLCQVAQSFLHYKTLGSSTSSLFKEYKNKIVLYPDPVHGFFCFDTELCTGLSGFSYCLWQLTYNWPDLLHSRNTANYSELESTPEGVVIDSLTIKHGELYRWRKMMNRIHLGKIDLPVSDTIKVGGSKFSRNLKIDNLDINELVNSNPELLFRHPNDPKELSTKLLLKASMPGVSKSLSKGSPLLQSISSSVHCLFTHCFSRTTITSEILQGVNKRKKKTEKISLLLSLKNRIEQSKEAFSAVDFESKMNRIFPLHERYLELSEAIEEFNNSDIKNIHSMRQTKSIIRLFPSESKLPLTMLQVVSKLWFGISQKTSNNMFNRCLNSTILQYPWVKNTIEESLSESPFNNYVELHSFISGQSQRTRIFHRTGPTIRSSVFKGQIRQLIRRCYKRNALLVDNYNKVETNKEKTPFKTKLSLALSIPIEGERNKFTLDIFEKITRHYVNPENCLNLSKRDFNIAIMAFYSQKKLSLENLQDLIREKGSGTIILFTKEQDRIKVKNEMKWKGHGECVAITEGVKLRIELIDNEVRRIYTKNPLYLRNNPGILRDLFEKLQSRPYSNRSFEVNCDMRFDGIRFQHVNSSGTPIICDQAIEVCPIEIEKCKLVISLNKCEIIAVNGLRSFPLIRVNSCINDIDIPSIQQGENDPWLAWVNCESLKAGKALKFIENMISYCDNPNNSERDINNLKTWSSETLNKRITHKGVGYSNIYYGESIASSDLYELDTNEDEDLDWWLKDLEEDLKGEKEAFQFVANAFSGTQERVLNDFKDNLLFECEDEELLDKVENIETLNDLLGVNVVWGPLASVLGNYATEETELSRTVHSYNLKNGLFLHPFWDQFIKEVHNIDNKFFSMTLQGIVSAKDEHASKLLMKLLSIKEKKKELNIVDRLNRLAAYERRQEEDSDTEVIASDPWW